MKMRIKKSVTLVSVALAGMTLLDGAYGQEAVPKPEGAFAGTIGVTRLESTPAWAKQPEAKKGAPNVLLVLLDDAGFGASSTFGGLAQTPNLDKLAASGVRYNRFHTVGICSPTRAALLTGRNHHQVGFGNLQEFSAGFPGYTTMWKKETATIAEVLKQNGYSTAAFGKWHNTPNWELSSAGPFDRWPTGLGFEYFYGFFGGNSNHWEPAMYRNTLRTEAPAKPKDGYHMTTDLVNDAIRWVHEHDVAAAERPYFMYFATGAVHTPHHVPKEWIAKNKGCYDGGWDKYREETFARQKKMGIIPADAELTPRPASLPAWDSLDPDQKRLYAHQMEVYSAFLEQTDYEVGRLVEAVRRAPGGDNTLILYVVGDNGGSAEGTLEGASFGSRALSGGFKETVADQLKHSDDLGGPNYDNHYSAGWGWATSAPFQWMKQVASHFGATRNPLIVSWPGHTQASGTMRSQFSHVNDIAPTIYEAAGVTMPDVVNGIAQVPLEGKSLLETFENPKAPEKHTVQYFDIFGNRAIYKDGWIAAAKRDYDPWNSYRQPLKVINPRFEERWELYNIDQDFSQAKDLADTNPDKMAELKTVFDSEARRNSVYPLVPMPDKPPYVKEKHKQKKFVFPGDIGPVPIETIPDLTGKSYRMEVDLQAPPANASGVLVAEGGRYGGFVLYIKDGHLIYEINTFGQYRANITSKEPLPQGKGKVIIAYEFSTDFTIPSLEDLYFPKAKAGKGRLYVNGKLVGEAKFEKFGSIKAGESLDIGMDRGSPVTDAYVGPFPYTGKIDEVRLEYH
jgi:arylsulfatase A-like enzyme